MKKVFASKMPAQQLDVLQQMVTKHLADPSLRDIAGSSDFAATSTERGLLRWEQAHLVAALDVLNAYQRDRRSRSACHIGSLRLNRSKDFSSDPRTRVVELLKRWLRTHAGNTTVSEEEVRGISGLCREILNHPALFPARNPRSFLQSIAEVYDHLQLQLREVLEQDRTCAELAQRVLSLGRNLISDAVGFLLLAPSDFRQTDSLPSLEVVSLWRTLPDGGQPLPGRADAALQKAMRDVWHSDCGAVLAAVLGTVHCVRLYDGARGEEESCRALEARASGHSPALENDAVAQGGGTSSEASGLTVHERIEQAQATFLNGSFRNSGLAGAFRDAKDESQVRSSYLAAVGLIYDLVYLLAEVLVQFHRISDGLGDYGMIRMSRWLHPFLDALLDKVQKLRYRLEHINEAVEQAYVLAKARHGRVEKPAPSDRMCSRAHACIERAVTGKSSHAKALAQAVDELRARSAPERLPVVSGGLGDACRTLQAILQSPAFRAAVGGPLADLPSLGDIAGSTARDMDMERVRSPQLQLADAPAIEADSPPRAVEVIDDEELPPAKSHGYQCEASRSFSTVQSDSTAASSRSDGAAAPAPAAAAGATAAQVWNCTPSRLTGGLKRRDRRNIVVHDRCLHIFARGSATRVEAVMDPALDMAQCSLDGVVLKLTARRLPDGASWDDGVFEHADFALEFSSPAAAAAVHAELVHLSGA